MGSEGEECGLERSVSTKLITMPKIMYKIIISQ
jgi:hypothetical protein